MPVFVISPGLVQDRDDGGAFADDAPWTPPELRPSARRELASGRFDALAGRYLHAEHDPPDELEQRIDRILAEDLNALRLRREPTSCSEQLGRTWARSRSGARTAQQLALRGEERGGGVQLAPVLAEGPGHDDALLTFVRQAPDLAVMRPRTISPRPGPPTAQAPGQSIAAQTTSGRPHSASTARRGRRPRDLTGVDAKSVVRAHPAREALRELLATHTDVTGSRIPRLGERDRAGTARARARAATASATRPRRPGAARAAVSARPGAAVRAAEVAAASPLPVHRRKPQAGRPSSRRCRTSKGPGSDARW